MLEWIIKQKDWVFSGIGTSIILGIISFIIGYVTKGIVYNFKDKSVNKVTQKNNEIQNGDMVGRDKYGK